MTIQQSSTTETGPGGDFGANEWLVEEMYERYLADPGSVDAAWHDFFADYRGPAIGSADSDEAESEPAPAATGWTTAPEPSVAVAPVEGVSAPTQPRVAPPAQGPATDQVPATDQPPAPATSVAPKPATQAATQSASDGPGEEVTKIRGAAARVVTNMETSLSVPTATSVRAVPAKLIADNRVVINNHLRRGRGGKVSFTHIIGYAMVKATIAHPEMNAHFAEVDGKPSLVTPEHLNFGLAIDLVGKDGGRQLVVASIKAAETLDFAQF